MSVYKGSIEQEDIYIGDTKISEVYKGSSLVYNSYQEPWYKSDNSGYGYKFYKAGDAGLTDKGTYNKKTLMIRGGLYSLVDGYMWYNQMKSKANLSDVTYCSSYSVPCFFKNGTLYTIASTTYYSRLTGGWSKGCFGSSAGYLYALKNKELYFIKFNAGNNPTVDTTTKIMDINNDIIFPKATTSKFLIIDNKLYNGFNSYNTSLTLIDDTGIWTCCVSAYGIKDGKLYKIKSDNSFVLVNDSKTWIDIAETASNSKYFALANDGTLALLTYSSDNTINIELDPIPELKGRWEKFTNTPTNSFTGKPYRTLAIRNGALYALNYNKDYILLDDTKYYTEVDGDYNSSGSGLHMVAVYSGNRILA